MADRASSLKIGIVGYGHLGQFLVEKIQKEGPEVGSPSALSEPQLEQELCTAANHHGRTLYIPSGALWGGQDIQRMNSNGTLKALSIRMSKHPSCFRLTGSLLTDWTEGEGRRVLFHGSVAELCPIAPNNVNTMAAAAIAASKLGFRGVTGEIVSDTALADYHIVEVEATGPDGFMVKTVRKNPAKLGAVTGNATYNSFWSSLLGMYVKTTKVKVKAKSKECSKPDIVEKMFFCYAIINFQFYRPLKINLRF
ncbi:putative L-aspartate dehydrogenase [Triplophysa tibetana]|uniref:Putative L-aspartate dehydrogenase n=1 Tax=Triplophysa tibetana TaxID=1572043 RepID=A0A5A9N786_9TELE|nr:putative L-aspartate dehydrogenase [Triplophysa tibetana]